MKHLIVVELCVYDPLTVERIKDVIRYGELCGEIEVQYIGDLPVNYSGLAAIVPNLHTYESVVRVNENHWVHDHKLGQVTTRPYSKLLHSPQPQPAVAVVGVPIKVDVTITNTDESWVEWWIPNHTGIITDWVNLAYDTESMADVLERYCKRQLMQPSGALDTTNVVLECIGEYTDPNQIPRSIMEICATASDETVESSVELVEPTTPRNKSYSVLKCGMWVATIFAAIGVGVYYGQIVVSGFKTTHQKHTPPLTPEYTYSAQK